MKRVSYSHLSSNVVVFHVYDLFLTTIDHFCGYTGKANIMLPYPDIGCLPGGEYISWYCENTNVTIAQEISNMGSVDAQNNI